MGRNKQEEKANADSYMDGLQLDRVLPALVGIGCMLGLSMMSPSERELQRQEDRFRPIDWTSIRRTLPMEQVKCSKHQQTRQQQHESSTGKCSRHSLLDTGHAPEKEKEKHKSSRHRRRSNSRRHRRTRSPSRERRKEQHEQQQPEKEDEQSHHHHRSHHREHGHYHDKREKSRDDRHTRNAEVQGRRPDFLPTPPQIHTQAQVPINQMQTTPQVSTIPSVPTSVEPLQQPTTTRNSILLPSRQPDRSAAITQPPKPALKSITPMTLAPDRPMRQPSSVLPAPLTGQLQSSSLMGNYNYNLNNNVNPSHTSTMNTVSSVSSVL